MIFVYKASAYPRYLTAVNGLGVIGTGVFHSLIRFADGKY